MATKRSKLKVKKGAWFVAVRGSFLPWSWQGWLTYIPFSAFLIWILVFAWNNTYDLSHALIVIIPNWVAAAAVMTWVAKRTS
jgi:hypothetical protein